MLQHSKQIQLITSFTILLAGPGHSCTYNSIGQSPSPPPLHRAELTRSTGSKLTRHSALSSHQLQFPSTTTVTARTVPWDGCFGVHHFFIFTSKSSCAVTLQGAVVLFPQICRIPVTGAAPPQQPVNPEQFAIWSPQCYQLFTSNHGPLFRTEH